MFILKYCLKFQILTISPGKKKKKLQKILGLRGFHRLISFSDRGEMTLIARDMNVG